MIRALACAIALTAPVPALALSCLAPSVERSYAQYDAAPEQYLIVHGRLTLDAADLPEGMTQDPPPERLVPVPARLKGTSMTATGFERPYDQAVTLEVSCLGPWCGSVGNGQDVLAFVRKDVDGYAIDVGPCGGAVFVTPKPAQLRRVLACFAQKDCSVSE